MTKKKYDSRIFYPFRTANGESFCAINYKGMAKTIPLDSEDFKLEFKSIFRDKEHEIITPSLFETIMEEMRLDAYRNRLNYNLQQRIFNHEDGSITYALSPSTSVHIHNGIAKLDKTPKYLFRFDSTFIEQTEPNLRVKPGILPKLIKRNFHLRNDEDVLLLTLYLVSAFSGNNIGHPILIFSGSKGSGKSHAARLISELVSCTNTDLTPIPKSRDDLAVKLHNSYLLVLDNISSLRWNTDLLAMAATGGTYSKRALYTDSQETALNLQCLLVLTGIEVATKESDILDRSLLLQLERLDTNKVMPETQLKESFASDKPKILGACFKLLAKALADSIPVEPPKTRMADAFDLMVKIGRALGYKDKEIAELLWRNQSKINHIAISDDIVGACVVALMETTDYFQGSVTEFLNALQKVAENNHIGKALLPKYPNVLSRKLNAIKSNLENEYCIKYTIKNIGAFRQIEIWRQ